MEKAGDKGESGFQRLVLMIGLPGAGKSTLARKIEESLSGKLKVEVISFDEIEKELSQSSIQFDPQVWSDARERAFNLAIGSLDSGKDVVILDDNFYYRSMRKGYYQLARARHISYLELFLQVDVIEALDRNSKREKNNRVPDHIIHSMALKLQEPTHPEHALMISNSTDPLTTIDSLTDYILSTSSKIPIPLKEEHNDQDPILSKEQEQTLLHEVDQSLRKEMSSFVKERPETKSKAKALNEIKSALFETLKSLLNSGFKSQLNSTKNVKETTTKLSKEAFLMAQSMVEELKSEEISKTQFKERLAELCRDLMSEV